MGKIIGVQFQKNGKMYYFDSNGFEVSIGDFVVVDTVRGYDLAEVIMAPREVDNDSWGSTLKKTIRTATEHDIQHSRDNRSKEKEAFAVCQKKIAEHKLEMKLVSVEYAFDNSKILFFFTANGRVDFRSLVKDLASIFKMRIELRQIGVRDEAKMLGGLGPCGRPICCGTFLDQFQPVSIKMAKEQNLSLNPTKISGVCGRLMCCLKYEQDHYEQTRRKMPRIGREVNTPDGTGPVTDLNIVKETVFVRLTNGDTSEIKEYPLESLTRTQDGQPYSEPAASHDSMTEGKKETGENHPKEDHQEKNDGKNADIFSDLDGKNTKGSQKPSKVRSQEKKRKSANALGQPVKRENPNRLSADAKQKHEANVSDTPSEAAVKSAQDRVHSGSSWADALQKAMQAIKQDK